MRISAPILFFCLVLLSGSCGPGKNGRQDQALDRNIPDSVYLFDTDLQRLIRVPYAQVEQAEGFSFAPGHIHDYLQLFRGDTIPWPGSRYLVCEVEHENPWSVKLYLDFYSEQQHSGRSGREQGGDVRSATDYPDPHIFFKVGIMPHLYTRAVMPLEYLDAQRIFLERSPRQMKAGARGDPLEQEEIRGLHFRLEPARSPGFLSEVRIHAIYLCDMVPEGSPEGQSPVVADEFGQWTMREWPGKVKSFEKLAANFRKMESEELPFTGAGRSRFGGWKEKQFEASGFFRTHFDGERWWLVDPDGYAFLSTGSDVIKPSAATPLLEEDLLEWIPDSTFSRFADCFETERGNYRMVDYLKANLIRVYGREWKSRWMELTRKYLKGYGFNTIANWSDPELIATSGIPYVLNMVDYPSTEVKLFRDFPDVFDPEYRERARTFATQLVPHRDDHLMIGYFLRNEPQWAFGEFNLGFEMLRSHPGSHSRKALGEWLKRKYGCPVAWSEAWNRNFGSFEETCGLIVKSRKNCNSQMMDDLQEFSFLLVDTYVGTVCEEVRKVDPVHLNLGMRYAFISGELCYRAAEYFDVFSINGYSEPGPPETTDIYARVGKPIMIGEFHFGAIDRGLPATGIRGVATQEDRGLAYRVYVEDGFSRPEVIGIHHFQWNDQHILGRRDGENYNIGFFDITMQPYRVLLEAACETHRAMYGVAAGSRPPFDADPVRIPQIYY